MSSDHPRVSGVILAAGASSRMGQPKQLLPLGDDPLLRHVIRAALASNLAEVVVVLGYQAEAIIAAVGPLGHKIVVNPHYAEGQSTSLRSGLAAIDSASEGVLFLLGDQPEVSVAVINGLIDAFVGRASPIVAPQYRDTRGHPVLFARELFAELTAVSGDVGAREVMAKHRDSLRTVSFPETPAPPDVDTPSAYEALVQRWNVDVSASER